MGAQLQPHGRGGNRTQGAHSSGDFARPQAGAPYIPPAYREQHRERLQTAERESRASYNATSKRRWRRNAVVGAHGGEMSSSSSSSSMSCIFGEDMEEETRGMPATTIGKRGGLSETQLRRPLSEVLVLKETPDERCSICQYDFEKGETVRVLGCKHRFHKDCVDKWLPINCSCPVCRKHPAKA